MKYFDIFLADGVDYLCSLVNDDSSLSVSKAVIFAKDFIIEIGKFLRFRLLRIIR